MASSVRLHIYVPSHIWGGGQGGRPLPSRPLTSPLLVSLLPSGAERASRAQKFPLFPSLPFFLPSPSSRPSSPSPSYPVRPLIYDWNIVDCGVKQQIHLTISVLPRLDPSPGCGSLDRVTPSEMPCTWTEIALCYWVWVYWCFTSHATIFQS